MESLIGEFPKIGKFLVLPSPEKSGENSPALRTNSESFSLKSLYDFEIQIDKIILSVIFA